MTSANLIRNQADEASDLDEFCAIYHEYFPLKVALDFNGRLRADDQPFAQRICKMVRNQHSFVRALETYKKIFSHLTELLVETTRVGLIRQVTNSIAIELVADLRDAHMLPIGQSINEAEEWLFEIGQNLKAHVSETVIPMQSQPDDDFRLIVQVASLKIGLDTVATSSRLGEVLADIHRVREYLNRYIRYGDHLDVDELADRLGASRKEAKAAKTVGMTVEQLAKVLDTDETVVTRLQDGNPTASDLAVLIRETRHCLRSIEILEDEKMCSAAAAISRTADYAFSHKLDNQVIEQLLLKPKDGRK